MPPSLMTFGGVVERLGVLGGWFVGKEVGD